MMAPFSKPVFEKIKSTFSSAAIEVLEALFGKKFENKMPWEVVDQLQCQFDKILTLGASSDKFRAICCAGVQNESFRALSGMDEISDQDACDILGEFCNCYHGVLYNNKDFLDSFGVLEQAVPVLYAEGHSYLPFISGIQGYAYCGNHWIYVGYSICTNSKISSAEIK